MGCGSCSNKNSVSINSVKKFKKSRLTQKIQPFSSFSSIYELKDQLFSSAFSEVRRCFHKAAGLERTVKIYKNIREELSENDLHERILALSELDHPNIIKIFDLIYDCNRIYLVLENWSGGLLLDMLTQCSAITEKEIVNIAEQMLSAISLAHSQGITHGDLNLSQIYLIDTQGKLWVKLIGFGLSSLTKQKHMHYVAPECHSGLPRVESDIWSIGVILYILFTGTPPFNKLNLDWHSHEPVFSTFSLEKSGTSSYAIDMISKMLVIKPEDRISAEKALMHPWIQSFKLEQHQGCLTSSLENLKKFKKSAKFKEAIHEFIANQILKNCEIKEMQETFKMLDRNGDGKLARSELFAYFMKRMSRNEAEGIINSIMHQSDTDQSGYLEFTEFIKAGVMQEHFVSRQNLISAFSLLDSDSSGKLSIAELEELGADSEIIQDLINKADKDNDGEIDFKEFFTIIVDT